MSWIRIHIGNADPDPGAWKLTKINYKPGVLFFKKAFLFTVRRYRTYVLDPHWFGFLDPDTD
jgi:hypothetical protein